MNESDVRAAIAAENETAAEIADHLEMHPNHVSKELKKMADDANNSVSRERDGRTYSYSVGPVESHPEVRIPGETQPDGGSVTVDTSHKTGANPLSFDERTESMPAVWTDSFAVPTDVPEYIPSGSELEELNQEIDDRHETEKPVRTILSGDTGTGKTHIARWIAQQRGIPLISIQGTPDLRAADVIGTPVFSGSGSFYQPGPVPETLRKSNDGLVMLLFDEANRAPAQTKAALFEALDDRGSVTIPEIGNQTIRGEPLDIILIATMNEGPGYKVKELDNAEKRRYSAKRYLHYLGDRTYGDPKSEARLLETRTPASFELAESVVEVANKIRRRARESGDDIQIAVATGTLLDWLRAAYSYDRNPELGNPIVRAANNFVINPWHEGDSKAAVSELIEERFGGMKFNGELETNDDGEPETGEFVQYRCTDCGWSAPEDSAPSKATDFRECPECGGFAKERTRTTPPETWE